MNDRFSYTESASDAAVMAAVRQGIKHVIFIIKENRTYDQILGDLEIGNGDPHLTEFGETITPNQHDLAQAFVTLDNFIDTAEVSYDGWLWTTSARAPDVVEHQFPVAYACRGLSLDTEGCESQRERGLPMPPPAPRSAVAPANRRSLHTERSGSVAGPDRRGCARMDRTMKSIPAICGTPRCGRVSRFATTVSSWTRPAIQPPTSPFPCCATRSRPARPWPIPRVSPSPRSPIRTSAVSTTRFRIITATRSGSESSMPNTANSRKWTGDCLH